MRNYDPTFRFTTRNIIFGVIAGAALGLIIGAINHILVVTLL